MLFSSSSGRRCGAIACIALTLFASAAPGIAAADTVGYDVPTYVNMKAASEGAFKAKVSKVVDPMYENVRNMQPSRMACLNKWLDIDWSKLLAGDLEGLMMSMIRGIVSALWNAVLRAVCTVADTAWNMVTGVINSMGTDVTLPGGSGQVHVGLATYGNTVTYGVGGSVMGQGFQLNQGTPPNQMVNENKSWIQSGMDRVKSWYQ